MRRLRDWLVTPPVLLGFGLTLVGHDIVGRLVRPFSLRGFEYVMASLQRSLIGVFRWSGMKTHIERSPEIRDHTGYAFVSNHQSMVDIPLIGGTLVTNFPKYVSKKELARWIPSISLNLRYGGNAVIDRKNRDQALPAIRKMATAAQARNVSVVIFPEGTRSRDGEVKGFKRGGTVAMLEAADELPVVPVAIDGSWALLRHNLLPVPYGTKIRVRFGDPIPRHPGDAEAVAEEAERWIGKVLDEWRAEWGGSSTTDASAA